MNALNNLINHDNICHDENLQFGELPLSLTEDDSAAVSNGLQYMYSALPKPGTFRLKMYWVIDALIIPLECMACGKRTQLDYPRPSSSRT